MNKIETSKDFLAEIQKFKFVNSYNNEQIASKRNITKQSASAFFSAKNPTLNSILETIEAMDGELRIEITKKEKGGEN